MFYAKNIALFPLACLSHLKVLGNTWHSASRFSSANDSFQLGHLEVLLELIYGRLLILLSSGIKIHFDHS